MRLSDDVLKCVCFLCLKEKRGKETLHFFGTAFFASVLSQTLPEEFAYLYLITARHNIKGAKEKFAKDPKKYHPQLFVRINTADGETKVIELPDKWHCPANQAIDVAVMSADDLDDPTFDYKHIPLACAATAEKIRHHGVGIGSEVFVSGLFSLRKGSKRNLPIVRQGIIASMPDEPFLDKISGAKYDVYLTEIFSTRGMSGSPVHVVSNRGYVAGENPPCRALLLGLMMGHFRDELEGYPKDKGDDFHAGLSKVVPVQEILKVINGNTLLKKRQEEDRNMIKARAPKEDSGLVSQERV